MYTRPHTYISTCSSKRQDRIPYIKIYAIMVNICNNSASNVVYVAYFIRPKILLLSLVGYYQNPNQFWFTWIHRLTRGCVSAFLSFLYCNLCLIWGGYKMPGRLTILGSIWLGSFQTHFEQWRWHKPVEMHNSNAKFSTTLSITTLSYRWLLVCAQFAGWYDSFMLWTK